MVCMPTFMLNKNVMQKQKLKIFQHEIKNERLGCCDYCFSPSYFDCCLVLLHRYLGISVKWIFAIVLTLSFHSTGKDVCSVSDFYSIAWSIHDPTERHKKMTEWLTKGQNLCKSTDFIIIWNNISEWGGTADSHSLRGLIISGYELALEREKK